MAAGPEIIEYKGRVDTLIGNIRTLRLLTEDFAETVDTAAKVVDAVDKTGEVSEKIREAVDDQLSVLKVTKLVSPLSTPSKIMEDVLKVVRPVVKRIEDAVEDLDDLDGSMMFLSKLEGTLSTSATALNVVAGDLKTKEDSLVDLSSTMDDYIKLLNVATAAGNAWSGDFEALRDDVDVQLGQRNTAAEPLDAAFNAIVGKVNDILDIMDMAKLDIALAGGINLD
ncbi:MAG: hypothetical protein ACR2PF_00705, partial [Rhizobiaceae bacterium]